MTGPRLKCVFTLAVLPIIAVLLTIPAFAQVFPEYGAILKSRSGTNKMRFPTVSFPNSSQSRTQQQSQPVGDIAFVQNGDIYTVTADGSSFRRLTSDGKNAFPVWSPNGRYIAFSKASGTTETMSASLWVITSDGRNSKPLNKSSVHEAVYPVAWLPDGKGLIVSIRTLKTDSAPELSVITLNGKPYPPYSKWCDAGKKYGFWKDKAQQNRWQFTPGQAAAFSPDGKKMMFTASTTFEVEAPRLDIFEMTLASRNLRRLVQMPYFWSECLRWHPKASKLISAEEHYPASGDYEAGIWLRDGSGKVIKKLAAMPASSFGQADWSPNGSYIIYQTVDAKYPRVESPGDFPTLSSHSSVWAMKADGSGKYKLADNACHPNWR